MKNSCYTRELFIIPLSIAFDEPIFLKQLFQSNHWFISNILINYLIIRKPWKQVFYMLFTFVFEDSVLF